MESVYYPRRYVAPLAEAVDYLVAQVAIWEDGHFSASELGLSRIEAERVAARVLRTWIDDPLSVDGLTLLQHLREVRSDRE